MTQTTTPHDPEAIAASAASLRERLGPAPLAAVLLGSGWGPFADALRDARSVPYAELPAFPVLAIGGHAGVVSCGEIATSGAGGSSGTGPRVAVLAGRKHAYETGDATGMVGAIRSLAAWGVRVLVQTNAAGSLRSAMRPGELMLLADHLNIAQRSPLVGTGGDSRFCDLSSAYDPALRERAHAAALKAGAPLHEGVYAWVLGPQFETPAEIRMLRTLGADAVGMSTVPETIIARHAGLRVLALSIITNMAAGMQDEKLSHAHTLATASAAGQRAVAVLSAVVQALE